MYVTIYVTVITPGEVSLVSFSRASTAPFATTDSGPDGMDSFCVSSQSGSVSSLVGASILFNCCLREAGWSNRRIGRHLGRSDMVVARCWQQWITEGRVYRRGGSGRPRNTNDREDRAIRRVATSAPTTSLASIQRNLPPSRHPVPSRETIRRRLAEVT
ncbi:HTH_38 domain-containing protein [Trichonephila clavipes]|nr:HTH_38 domain-containing protein [Trichonephila clavipes]